MSPEDVPVIFRRGVVDEDLGLLVVDEPGDEADESSVDGSEARCHLVGIHFVHSWVVLGDDSFKVGLVALLTRRG